MALVTLTTRGGRGRTRDTALYALRVAFPRLRERMAYRMGKVEYILIPEQHKNGIVHAHMVATSDLTKRWFKDNAYQCGLGYMADVSPLEHGGQAARYVAKYIGKDFCGAVWPKGFRRVRTSRGWPKASAGERPEGWEYEAYKQDHAAWWAIYLLRDEGYTVKITASAELKV